MCFSENSIDCRKSQYMRIFKVPPICILTWWICTTAQWMASPGAPMVRARGTLSEGAGLLWRWWKHQAFPSSQTWSLARNAARRWKRKDLFIHPQIIPFNDVAFSPSSQYLAAGSSEGVVRIWPLQTKAQSSVNKHNWHSKSVNTLAWSHDDQLIVSGCDGGNILIYQRETASLLSPLASSTRAVSSNYLFLGYQYASIFSA